MKKIISLLLIITFSTCLFANTNSTSPEPYTDDEFPDWANYLRRYEVITLGSLPFTTMGVTTIYTLYRYIDNDFDKKYIPHYVTRGALCCTKITRTAITTSR